MTCRFVAVLLLLTKHKNNKIISVTEIKIKLNKAERN